MIMPFEGTHYEDEADVIDLIIPEPTHSPEEEAEYIDYILPGYCDDDCDDYCEGPSDDYDPDGWQVAQDRYDRWVYGE